MERKITGFHQDEHQDWVAELECGHTLHVRHQPPFQERPWVLTESGRYVHLGLLVDCMKCRSAGNSNAIHRRDPGNGNG